MRGKRKSKGLQAMHAMREGDMAMRGKAPSLAKSMPPGKPKKARGKRKM